MIAAGRKRVDPRSRSSLTENRLALLHETIDSVQAQTFQGWEHLIVDDGFEDGTVDEVAKGTAGQNPRFAFFAERLTSMGPSTIMAYSTSESDCPIQRIL